MTDIGAIRKAVTDVLCEHTTSRGLGAALSLSQLASLLPDFQQGHLGLAVHELVEEDVVEKHVHLSYIESRETTYSLKPEAYKQLVRS